MSRHFASAAAALALVAAAPAAAQTAPQPAGESTPVEPLVVTAPTREVISEFVRNISAPTRERKLARWNKTICPATLGLQRRYAEYLNDRLAAAAMQAGVKVGKPGCSPDLLIIVTADPKALLDQMAAEHGDFFAVNTFAHDRTSAGGGQDFAAFLASPEPVRWWHVSATVSAEGRPLGSSANTIRVTSATADGKGFGSPPALRVTSPSRLRDTVREDFQHALLIVDAGQARGVSYQALSDYVAMAALAQLDPRADTAGVPTILNLFKADAASRPDGLTDWDRAYLRGLYGARADAPDLRSQRGRILSTMRQR